MELQFSVVSYTVMAVFYIVGTVILFVLWRMLRPVRRRKYIMMFLVVLFMVLPWIDEIWIAYHFKEACKDAGIHVKRQVVVDGFYDATTYDNTNEEFVIEEPRFVERMKKSGFQFKERRTTYSKVRHLEVQDGKMVQTILDKPQSRYHYKQTHNHTAFGHQITKYEQVIWDSQLNENIGSDISYTRYPGWLDTLWVRFVGHGASICKGDVPNPPKSRHGIPHYVLIPTKTN